MQTNCRKFLNHSETGPFMGSIGLVKEIFQFRRVIFNLVRQKITRNYIQAKLGVLWIVIGPTLTIMVLALLFPLLMRNKMENFIVYLFSGLVVFTFVSTSINGGAGCIISREGLIKKIYLPKIIFPIIDTTSELVSVSLTLCALHLIALIFSFDVHTNIVYLILAIFLTYGFCLGITAVLSIAAAIVRDIQQIPSMIMRALFFLTPIIYPISALPEKAQKIMEFNPLFQYVRLFHTTIYGSENPDWGYFFWPVILTFSSLVLGLLVQWRFGRVVIYYL